MGTKTTSSEREKKVVHWQNNNKHDIIYERCAIQWCTIYEQEAVVTWLHDFILNIFLVAYIFVSFYFASFHSVRRSVDLTTNLKCHARTVTSKSRRNVLNGMPIKKKKKTESRRETINRVYMFYKNKIL